MLIVAYGSVGDALPVVKILELLNRWNVTPDLLIPMEWERHLLHCKYNDIKYFLSDYKLAMKLASTIYSKWSNMSVD